MFDVFDLMVLSRTSSKVDCFGELNINGGGGWQANSLFVKPNEKSNSISILGLLFVLELKLSIGLLNGFFIVIEFGELLLNKNVGELLLLILILLLKLLFIAFGKNIPKSV